MTEMWMSKALAFWIRLTLESTNKSTFEAFFSASLSFSIFFEQIRKIYYFVSIRNWFNMRVFELTCKKMLQNDWKGFHKKVKKVSEKGYVDSKLFSSFLCEERFEIWVHLNGHCWKFKAENWV